MVRQRGETQSEGRHGLRLEGGRGRVRGRQRAEGWEGNVGANREGRDSTRKLFPGIFRLLLFSFSCKYNISCPPGSITVISNHTLKHCLDLSDLCLSERPLLLILYPLPQQNNSNTNRYQRNIIQNVSCVTSTQHFD